MTTLKDLDIEYTPNNSATPIPDWSNEQPHNIKNIPKNEIDWLEMIKILSTLEHKFEVDTKNREIKIHLNHGSARQLKLYRDGKWFLN